MDIAGSGASTSSMPARIGMGREHVSARLEVPLVTYHGTFVSGFVEPGVQQGDLTIAVSDVIKDYIIKEFRFDGDRITVIPNGIDCRVPSCIGEETREIRGFPVLAGEGPVLVYASRMNPT